MYGFVYFTQCTYCHSNISVNRNLNVPFLLFHINALEREFEFCDFNIHCSALFCCHFLTVIHIVVFSGSANSCRLCVIHLLSSSSLLRISFMSKIELRASRNPFSDTSILVLV